MYYRYGRNLLAFETCCDWSLRLPVKVHAKLKKKKKNVCTTTNNNILTASSEEVALLCQTSLPNCGIPTSSNNIKLDKGYLPVG